MTSGGGSDERTDCLVVGGGLSGLACAQALCERGRSVRVVEGRAAVGGRARTDWHEGVPVDRGFQALFRAYPETRRLLDAIGLGRQEIQPFTRGAMVHDGRGWSRFGLDRASILRFGGLTAGDALRLGRLASEVVGRRPEHLLAVHGPPATTEAFLRERGFSPPAIEGLLRPLFGTIFLDRSLSADPGYFRFLLSMLARGPAVLPRDGLGMIAIWAEGAVRAAGGTVETGVPVASLDIAPDGRAVGVVASGGRRIVARHVVLALDPSAARVLLEPVDPASAARLPTHAAGALTAAFALETPLYRGRIILLNAAPANPGPRIDLVCQTTNVTRPQAVRGPHIVLATSVTTDSPEVPDRDALLEAVARLVARWNPRFPWRSQARPIDVYRHDFAQFRPLPGVRTSLPGPRTAIANLILAGDCVRHPSIEGAVASGREAARVVDALMGGTGR